MNNFFANPVDICRFNHKLFTICSGVDKIHPQEVDFVDKPAKFIADGPVIWYDGLVFGVDR
ncbi:hypothetical protein XYCOK13_28560 [Xylanibacillus composti]|uniref:Uncharacterized protein n=1 Tax=Xylanibacillus composti TaxID=1572762 RepID=A0A8J4H5Q6_9BACL|nr:hypothetical protein XYCOK13_28560 [Xylanibacillus composti]